jgi:ketosteroid isomerase-like protein
MPEEPTTPDLEEAVRRALEAFNRRDLDAALSLYAPDAVLVLAPGGFGMLEGAHLIGREAIRKSWEDLTEAFEDFESEIEDHHDLGSGVTFGVLVQRGRPHGSDAFVETRGAAVAVWRDGRIARATSYQDVDEARAAAERLAEERG